MTLSDRSEVGRALVSFRRREQRVCVVCGKEFEGTVRATYCSNRCKSLDYYRTHREAISEQRRARRQGPEEGN